MALSREVQAAMAEINKTYGAHTIVLASDMRPVERITSGSLALDAALGGGWMVNQWHEIIGDPSAGKTVTLLQTLAANQRLNPDFVCVWVASEYFDRPWAEENGVDTDRVIVVNENIMEKCFSISLQALDERWCDMLVIDSLPAMTPGDEAEKAMEDFQVGLTARLTNKFLRKQGTAGKRSLIEDDRACTCFLVNQWREKIGVMWGDPRTTGGGKMKDYTCVTRTEVKRDEWIEVGPKSARVKVGQTIKSRTLKNKTFPSQKVATVDFYFEDNGVHRAGEYDTFKEIVGLGVVYEVITQSGSWFSYEDIKTQGLPAMVLAIAEQPDVAERLSQEVLATATGKPYKQVDEVPEIPDEEPAPEPKKRVVKRSKK